VKRHGQLWERLVSFPNLLRAARRAARGKRWLANVVRFRFNLEEHLCRLQDELRDGTYRPGPYRTFEIYEPKRRLISAAPFRDRIVHHARYPGEHLFGPAERRRGLPLGNQSSQRAAEPAA
jgi:hypothetical protein